MVKIKNLNIESITPLESPIDFVNRLPIDANAATFVAQTRKNILDVIDGKDKRLLIIVGPCSIHDTKAGLEYAERLKDLSEQLSDRMLIIMRVYFEKPRTTVGWKGLINDPNLDNTFDVSSGLSIAREFLLKVLNLGLPTATEWLDPITPQYLADCITWGAIGARTVESQTHRQLASGLSMPIGYKNGTGGSLQIAVDAMVAAREPHVFLSIEEDGRVSIVKTKGNLGGHVVLRGGSSGPNFDAKSVSDVSSLMREAGFRPGIVIDCSHANSNKDHKRQPSVFNNVLSQRKNGNDEIIGVMIESHLNEGNQGMTSDPSKLQYGVSITDACVNWETTEALLREAYGIL